MESVHSHYERYSRVHKGNSKEGKGRGGGVVLLPEINAWPVGYKVGMGVDIQILEKSLCKGKNGRDYLQFITVRQLREAVSDVYSATSTAQARR